MSEDNSFITSNKNNNILPFKDSLKNSFLAPKIADKEISIDSPLNSNNEEADLERRKKALWASLKTGKKDKINDETKPFTDAEDANPETKRKRLWEDVRISHQDTSLNKQETKFIDKYDPNRIPCDIKKCYEHQQACCVRDIEGIDTLTKNTNDSDPTTGFKRSNTNKMEIPDHGMCECCGLLISHKKLNFYENPMKFRKNTGAGCTQYFELLKFYIYNLLIITCCVTLYKCIHNWLGKGCESDHFINEAYVCNVEWKLYFSIGRSHFDYVDHVEKALVFLSMFLMIPLNWYYIYWVNKVIGEWDDHDVTPYDYAVMIQHLPTDKENFNSVRYYFKNLKVNMPDHYHKIELNNEQNQDKKLEDETCSHKAVKLKSQVLCYFIVDYIEMKDKNVDYLTKILILKRAIEREKKLIKVEEMLVDMIIKKAYKDEIKVDQNDNESADEFSDCSSVEEPENHHHISITNYHYKLRTSCKKKICKFNHLREEKKRNNESIKKMVKEAKSCLKDFKWENMNKQLQSQNKKKESIFSKNDDQKVKDYQKFTGTAIVTFDTQKQRNAVLNKFRLSWFQLIFKSWLRMFGQIDQLTHSIDGHDCSKKEYVSKESGSNPPKDQENLKKNDQESQLENTEEHKKHKKFCCNIGKVFSKDKLYKEDASYLGVDVTEPPEPMDIQWENIGYHLGWKKWLLVEIGIFLLYVVTSICIYNLLELSDYMSDKVKKNEEGKALFHTDRSTQVICWIISMCIAASNGLLTTVFRLITAAERHFTHTHHNFILAKRVAIGQYVNSAFIVTIATWYMYKDNVYYSKLTFSDGGIAWNGFMIMITNLYIHPLFVFFNPGWFIKKFKQWKIKRNPENYTQAFANAEFEPIEPEFAEWTADAISAVFCAVFFLPIVPQGSVVCLVGIMMQFISDKIGILTFYRRPSVLSPDLVIKMIQRFDKILFVIAKSQIIWDYWLRAEVSYWSIALAIFVSIYKICMVNVWVDKKCRQILQERKEKQAGKKDEECEEEIQFDENTPYDDVRTKFITEYDRENPQTAINATRKWQQYIEARKERISKQVPEVKNMFATALGDVIGLKMDTGGSFNDSELDLMDENIGDIDLDFAALDSYANKVSKNKHVHLGDSRCCGTDAKTKAVEGMLNFVFKKENNNITYKYDQRGGEAAIEEKLQMFLTENSGFSKALFELIIGGIKGNNKLDIVDEENNKKLDIIDEEDIDIDWYIPEDSEDIPKKINTFNIQKRVSSQLYTQDKIMETQKSNDQKR